MSLAVVCCHFNPAGYQESRRNLLRFYRQLSSMKIPIFVGELAYDDENFFLPEDVCSIRYRTTSSNILWHKENLLNLIVKSVPRTYDKIAWIDPDIWFMNARWFGMAEKALDERPIIQLFHEVAWTDRSGLLRRKVNSCISRGESSLENHPGFAWAARRQLWDEAGGLCEFAIIGGADVLLTAACLKEQLPSFFHYPNWERWLQPSAEWIHENGGVGCIEGLIVHEWHGELKNRDYINRYKLLAGVNIDGLLERRPDGLLNYSATASKEVKTGIRDYFKGRQEDGVVS